MLQNTVKTKFIFSILFGAIIALSSCKKDTETPTPTPSNPETYTFNYVSYGGQTVRILLLDTLMKRIKSVEKAGANPLTSSELVSFYENSSSLFSTIAIGKKLSDKIFGGPGGAYDLRIRAYFDSLAILSSKFNGTVKATTLSNGLYLPQIIEKTIMGGVFYFNSLDYINEKAPLADNNTVNPIEGTNMQHNWDEGFGYLGMSKYYKSFTDEELGKNPSFKDINSDGKIDFTSEQNFYYGRYFGQRDFGFTVYSNKNWDFSGTIFNAFLKGRQAINEKNTSNLLSYSKIISENLDMVVAANVIKYAKDCQLIINDPAALSSKWSEMYAFHEMIKVNSAAKLKGTNYVTASNLIGLKPADTDLNKLDEVIKLYKSTYGF